MISTYVCLVSLGSVLLLEEGCFTASGRLAEALTVGTALTGVVKDSALILIRRRPRG